MKKRYNLVDLDCANCAAKMEAAVRKLDGVQECTISFMTQRMTLTAPDDRLDAVLDAAVACIAKVEPDCEVLR